MRRSSTARSTLPDGLLERLLAVVEGFNAGMSPGQVASAYVDLAVDFTGAVGGVFARADGSDLSVTAAARGAEDLHGFGYPVRDSVFEQLAGSDLPTLQGSLDLLSARIAAGLRERGIRRFAACRAHSMGRISGMLALFFDTDGPELDFEQLALLRTMAALAAGALAVAELDEADRIYLATASHELRTPITVMQGFATVLEEHWDQLPDSERLDEIRIIRRRADELSTLIEDVTQRSRGDSDAVAIDAQPFDAAARLSQTVEGMRSLSTQEIRLSVAEDSPVVLGDRAMFGVVVTELVTNAMKYSPEDQPIDVALYPDGAYAVVAVSDRGPGVDPAQTERMFARFWRAHADGEFAGTGAGFGLYMVRRLIESQGGWVSIQPRDGGGTEVDIRLPIAAPQPGIEVARG